MSYIILQVFLGPTVSYISSKPFARGLHIALMMEVVRTCETSVYFSDITMPFILEGFMFSIFLSCEVYLFKDNAVSA
jgi:hypothetical protein